MMNESSAMRPTMQKITSTGPTTTNTLNNLEKKELEDARKLIARLEADLAAKDKIIEKQRADLTKLRKENFDLKHKSRSSNGNNSDNDNQNERPERPERSGPDRDTLRQIEMAMRM